MGINTVTTVTCDAPRCSYAIGSDTPSREIDTTQEYLQAGTYGFYAHKECFLALTPVELCKALGLDEVEVETMREGSRPVRVWSRWS